MLTYFYALLLGIRRNDAQNDLAECDRRLKTAIDGDPVRTSARRVEILLRCLIKLDGMNPLILGKTIKMQTTEDNCTCNSYTMKKYKKTFI